MWALMESNCFENSFIFYSAIPLECKTKSCINPVGLKSEYRAIIELVGQKLKSQTDTRTEQLHKNDKLNLKPNPLKVN